MRNALKLVLQQLMYLVAEVGRDGMESVWPDVMTYRPSALGLYVMTLSHGGHQPQIGRTGQTLKTLTIKTFPLFFSSQSKTSQFIEKREIFPHFAFDLIFFFATKPS